MSDSLVSVEVDGERFPYRSESRCQTCSSPFRLELEKALVRGWSYERIVAEHGGGTVSARSLHNHVLRKHVPINSAAVRRVANATTHEVSQALEPVVTAAAANLSFAHAVVGRISERLASGEVEPTVRDGLAAARLISESESLAGPSDLLEWQDEFMALFEIAKEVMSVEQFDEFSARLHRRNRLRTR